MIPVPPYTAYATIDQQRKIHELRTLLFSGIEKSLKKDGHHKSYEGAVTLSIKYPNYFEDDASGNGYQYVLTIDCYVLGPRRHYTWEGTNLDKVIDEAIYCVKQWIHDEE